RIVPAIALNSGSLNLGRWLVLVLAFFFKAEDGIRDDLVTGVQTCALPICAYLSMKSLTSPNFSWTDTRGATTGRRGRCPRSSSKIGRASCREREELSVDGVTEEKIHAEAVDYQHQERVPLLDPTPNWAASL